MNSNLIDFARSMQPRFADPSVDVVSSAAGLASCFALGVRVRESFPELLTHFHRRLLHETVRWASRASPYYQRTLSGIDCGKTIISTDEFESVPIITREDVSANIAEMRVPECNFALATFTSGTTTGIQLIIDRCTEEQSYLNEFASSLSKPKWLKEKMFAMRLVTPWHGRVLQLPSVFELVPVNVTTMSGLVTALNLLKRSYMWDGQERRIAALGGGLISLRRLTKYLERTADKEALPRISTLHCTSEYVTHSARRQLESFWGQPLIDRYGLSESVVGAWRCTKCQRYHFEPYGFPEVIPCGSERPVSEGVGRLIVTGYFPFVRTMPFIRYDTGDVVRLHPSGCPSGRPGFELLGRIGRSVLSGDDWVIGEYEIYDILDEFEHLERGPVQKQFPEWLQDAGSFPLFRVENDGPTWSLHVIVRHGRALEPSASEQLRFDIRGLMEKRTGRPWNVCLSSGVEQ